MDLNEEYHDPDYAGTSVVVKEEPQTEPEEEKIYKIRSIVRREFDRELEERENEVGLVDQRVRGARRLLHRLRCCIVTRYYQASRLQLCGSQVQDELAAQQEPWAKAETASLLREGQRRIHPSVRKLLGKRQVDLEDIFKHRPPRNNTRKNYSAMVQTRNYTIAADKTKSLRPLDATTVETKRPADDEPSCSRPKKVPRRIDPKIENVVTLNDAARNQQKHRFRIIIGNTSKYAAPASRADRSTHKWLLYVRGAVGAVGAVGAGTLSGVVTAVTVTLHHSYAPHHIVQIDKPPYHVSRRGWGEFPARVELHFAQPHRNRPASVDHTIKLDRNYTGLQTLGAETVVDVWLYSDEEMLKHEFLEDPQAALEVKTEAPEVPPEPQPAPEEDPNHELDSWFDFFNKENTELDVDEMIIKAVKKEPEQLVEDKEVTNDTIVKQEPAEQIETEFDPEQVNETSQTRVEIKSEPEAVPRDNSLAALQENLLDSIPTQLLNQPTSVKKRIMKYMDPTTGKIYYLEMDRDLDLTKVQEIVINSKGNVKTAKISPIKSNGLKSVRKPPRKGISLLKPEITNRLKAEPSPRTAAKTEKVSPKSNNYRHIGNDHCYLGTAWSDTVNFQTSPRKPTVLPPPAQKLITTSAAIVKKEIELVKKRACLHDQLCSTVKRFSCERIAVNYLLSKIPLVGKENRDSEFWRNLPFVVENEDVYWKLDFAKRRNIEWSRAKTINKILAQHSNLNPTWRTKQILLFSRLHGYYPIREEKFTAASNPDPTDQWSSWNDLENTRKVETTIKEIFPNPSDINSLTQFRQEDYLTPDGITDSIDLTEVEEEVDVVCDPPANAQREVLPDSASKLEVLPVDGEENKQRFLFLERKCRDIGIELRNEDVGNGYSHSAVHAVLLTAMKRFADDLIRESLAVKRLEGKVAGSAPLPIWTDTVDAVRPTITLQHLWGALRRGRATVSGAGRGVVPQTNCPL